MSETVYDEARSDLGISAAYLGNLWRWLTEGGTMPLTEVSSEWLAQRSIEILYVERVVLADRERGTMLRRRLLREWRDRGIIDPEDGDTA